VLIFVFLLFNTGFPCALVWLPGG